MEHRTTNWGTSAHAACCPSGEAIPQTVSGEEVANLVEFDVCALRTVDRGAGHPPLGARQAGRQIGAATWSVTALRVSRLGHDDPVIRLPERDDQFRLVHNNGVEPTPQDDFRAARLGDNGHQVAGRHPPGAWPGEGQRVRHHARPIVGEDSALILGSAEDDRCLQPSSGSLSLR
jgi:hypothetical protein